LKRFTDTQKWHDEWYRNLSPVYKCAWHYICDNCDNAGVWKKDFKLMSFCIGEEIKEEEFNTIFCGRIEQFGKDKIWIIGFIDFQAGKLKEGNKPHEQIISLLEEYDLFDKYFNISKKNKGYTKGMDTLQDKDKDKDKDIRQEVEKQFRKQEEFTDFQKQRICIKSFIKKCKIKNVDPLVFMTAFRELQERDKIFKDLPFSPSILSSWFDSAFKKMRFEKNESHFCDVCKKPKVKEYGVWKCPACANTS